MLCSEVMALLAYHCCVRQLLTSSFWMNGSDNDGFFFFLDKDFVSLAIGAHIREY